MIPDVTCRRSTEKAILVALSGLDPGIREVWIPRSVIDDDSEVWGSKYDDGEDACGPGDLILARWWVRANGLEDIAEEWPP